MRKNVTKWFWMIGIIAMALSITTSTAFTEGTDKGTKEGIKVHGHWKIEIFNPDGTRASVTEFANSLFIGAGDTYLKWLLTGDAVHGSWGIQLWGDLPNRPCDDGTGNSEPCRIGESGGSYPITNIHSSNLVVSTSSTPDSIGLSGSVTAAYASTIEYVQTTTSYCPSTLNPVSTVDPITCKANNSMIWNVFTQATLGTQPSVVAGQLIQVTVTISFG